MSVKSPIWTMNRATAAGELCSLSRHSILSTIGQTPLLRVRSLEAGLPGIEIYAKAEFFNPGGSVKDRPALYMVLEGERSGKLTRDKILLDATSGNTGIAYALIGAALGYRVRLCVPANVSIERKRLLRALGAEVILTNPAEGSDGAIRKCRQMYEEEPELYFYPDQYNNPANWRAHYETTGPEILEQTAGRITHFIAGIGTSGTFTGVTRRLRQELNRIKCYTVQPDSGFHGIEGLKHMPTAIVPGIYDPSLADGNYWVPTEDAQRVTKELARKEGVLVGVSAGANLWAARKLAEELHRQGQQAVIVTILPDGAEKYLSESFWEEDENTYDSD